MSDQTLDACPHCGAGVLIMDNGKECRAASGAWVTFDCLTAIHAGEHPRMSQSRNCEEAEREKLAMEVAALRTANAGLVEKVAETQSELDKSARILLETVNDRNRIGAQLDLIRDELMRIRARIAETGLILDAIDEWNKAKSQP